MAKLTVPIRVDALEEAKAHAKEYYDKGYQQGRAKGIEEFDKALRTNTLIPNWCYQLVRSVKKELLKERSNG